MKTLFKLMIVAFGLVMLAVYASIPDEVLDPSLRTPEFVAQKQAREQLRSDRVAGRQAIKRMVKFEDSLAFDYSKSYAEPADAAGTRKTVLYFTAKSPIGADIPHIAVCEFPKDGPPTIDIATL